MRTALQEDRGGLGSRYRQNGETTTANIFPEGKTEVTAVVDCKTIELRKGFCSLLVKTKGEERRMASFAA